MKIIKITDKRPAVFGFGQISHDPDDYYEDDIKPYVLSYLPVVSEIECEGCKIIVYECAGWYCIRVVADNGWEISGTRLFSNCISPDALCAEAERMLKTIAPLV